MTDTTQRPVLPVLDTFFSMQRRSMELLALMISEPVETMTHLPRASLRPAVRTAQELISAGEQTVQISRQTLDAVTPVLDLLFSLPGLYAGIMARAISAPIETSIVQFRRPEEVQSAGD